MRYLIHNNKGMTLIEALIYAFLLSFLITGLITYAYELHIYTLRLMDDIEDEWF